MFEKNFALYLLRDLLRDTVAGVTTIATLALPIVVGAAGLAFDLNRGYQQRVIIQRAADMAALGAAMAYRDSGEESVITPVAQDIAAANGLSGAVVVATLQADFPSAGQEAILVTVSMPTPYILASVLGFSGSFNVTAESYSSVSGGGGSAYSSCLLALDETESKAIWFNGNPTVDSPCGIAALSNASDVIRISGAPGDYNVGTVVTAGGVYDQHGGFSSATVLTGITGMVDPYAGLTLPDNPTERSLSCEPATTTFTADATTTVSVTYEYYKGQNQNKATPYNHPDPQPDSTSSSTQYGQTYSSVPSGSSSSSTNWTQIGGSGKNKIYEVATTTETVSYSNVQTQTSGGGNMQPGTYSDFTISCDTTLDPGIYVLEGIFSMAGGNSLTGTGVMFVLKDGASISITGNSTLNISGMSEQQLISAGVNPIDAARMDGMLVFEDPDGPGAAEHKFRGTTDLYMSGVIYTPKTEVSLLGTPVGVDRCVSIAARMIQIGGTADLYNMCPPGMQSEIEVQPGGGDQIRLIK